MKNYMHDIDCINEFFGIFNSILNEVESEERESHDTPIMVIDAVREKLKEKENEIRKELNEELLSRVKYLNFQQTAKDFVGSLYGVRADCGVYPAYK